MLELSSRDLMVISTDLRGIGRLSWDRPTFHDLLEYLITTDLDILNARNTSTFHNSVREEVIDIILYTGTFRNSIRKWRVSDEPILSDHSQIEFEIEFIEPSGPIWVRNPRRTDWNRYSTELKSTLSEVPRSIKDLNTLEIAAKTFTEAIKLSYESNCRPTCKKRQNERTMNLIRGDEK